jgi:CRISPR/Cas system-associated exonuclease Cas4 (RecB family)
MTGPLSHTRISTYSDCGEKFRLQYLVEGLEREPQGALLGGISVHDTVERMERDGLALDEHAYESDGIAQVYFTTRLNQHVEEAGGVDAIRWGGQRSKAFPEGKNYDWWSLYGPGMVRRYHETRLADEMVGLEVVGVEMEVNALLPSGTYLTTRIDQLLRVKDGDEVYIIRDWKTGMPRPASKLQAAIYGYAVRQTIGVKVTRGQISYLALSQPRIDDFDVQTLTDVALGWVEQVERGMDQGIYVMNPGGYCASCSVRAACSWGQTLSEEASGA